jgi:hypothetical protein
MPSGLLLASGEYYAGGDLGPAFDATRQTVLTPPTPLLKHGFDLGPKPKPRPKRRLKRGTQRKDVNMSKRAISRRRHATKKSAEVKQRLDSIPVMQQKIALLQALVQKQFVYARHQENLVSRIAMCSLTLYLILASILARRRLGGATKHRVAGPQGGCLRGNFCCTRGEHRR